MEEKKMMVEEKKERTKRRRRKKEQKRRRRKRREKKGGIFLKSQERWANEKKKNPPQCLVWFRLNGLGSSQNGQNSLIHNWCIGGCWFILAHEIKVWIMFLLVAGT
jgi:hypothetical protein